MIDETSVLKDDGKTNEIYMRKGWRCWETGLVDVDRCWLMLVGGIVCL